MSKALRTALLAFRAKLDEQGRAKRQARVERLKQQEEKGAPTGMLRNFQMAADVQALVADIRAAAARDLGAYQPRNVAAPEGVPAPKPPAPAPGHFAAALRQQVAAALQPPDADEGPAAHFDRVLSTEIAALSEDGVLLGKVGGAFVPKLRNAQQAFASQRHGDVATILKSALRNEPHNSVLLFVTSQFLYFMANHGQPDALPEARDLAQKAITANERLPDARLMLYRYLCVATEAGHDPARALGWMREHRMLQPQAMQQGGLAVMEAMPLKLWAIVAGFDPALWGEVEFSALKAMVLHVVGGAALYLGLLRPVLADAALNGNTPPPALEEIEKAVAVVYGHYQDIAPALEKLPAQHQARGALPPWVVRARYMALLAGAAPRPTFDQMLLNISISGDNFKPGGYPEGEVMAALGEPGIHYWRLWTLSVTVAKELRQGYFLPAAEALEDNALMADCDGLLALLQQAEQALVKPAVWADIKPWMIRWQLEHLLAAGTGSNHPRERFAPSGGPLSLCYRQWAQPGAQGILASEILLHTARAGGFADMNEVLAAFEGAYRLLDDPAHGLVATQKRALKAAQDQNPKRFGSMYIDDGGMSGSQMMMVLLPLLLIGGIGLIVMGTRNMGQAVGLSLALAGFVGVAMIGMSRK